MAFPVPDASWVFNSIDYINQAVTDPRRYYHHIHASRIGDTIYLSEMFGAPDCTFTTTQGYTEINGIIHFTNGKSLSFLVDLAGSDYSLCNTGTLTGYIEPHHTVPVVGQPGAFKPSGFGVKQIGIADYKKVEQTLHCYVEGEVAHIENIMAREYREKSTRRLRRSENTTTTSSESEREKLTDTTTTDRFEMQNEVAKVMQESRDFSANTSFSAKWGPVQFGGGANYATHNSKEESTRAAVTQAKDITERAMDRVVSRVKQERIEKVIEEFEENNKHGFDNTKGDKHVVGVYRWVDKIYKNQIFNYGKRLMFEFMVPEPAKLHYLGMKEMASSAAKVITKPVDPRTASQLTMGTYAAVGENEARYWASMFNVEIEAIPAMDIVVGKSFNYNSNTGETAYSQSANLEIPEDYVGTTAQINFTGMEGGTYGWDRKVIASVGNESRISHPQRIEQTGYFPISRFWNSIPVAMSCTNFLSCTVTINVGCTLTDAGKAKWQQRTFKLIIDAYQTALTQYEDDLAEQQVVADNIKGTNPGFYREIENTVLRKNCISYLIDQDPTAALTYGKQMYNTAGKDAFADYELGVNKSLDDYTSFAKFLEQAFEWDIMSYYFYPYYWGNRADWASMYQVDNNDPLFRNFMQSGLGRVVVTVRPGFEDAVRFYMQTGMVWNGGEVPVIDDPLHLSIVDELREPTGLPEGKAWATRVPTSLTILQADSIGLKVEKALPCNCDDVSAETWENPELVPCGDNFELVNQLMNTPTKSSMIQFSYVGLDRGYPYIQEFDNKELFPRRFRCMGQEITIDREEEWQGTDSAALVYQKLAQELSAIPGIKAEKIEPDNWLFGIKFTIDQSIVPVFQFHDSNDQPDRSLKVYISSRNIFLMVPLGYDNKVLDKGDTLIEPEEIGKPLPLVRFQL